GQQRDAPACHGRNPGKKYRRDGPSERAGQSVHAERMPETRHGDAPVEQREIRRMEYAIAQPGHAGKQNQHRIVLTRGQAERRNAKQGNAAQQYAQGAKTIHDESRQRLAYSGNDEKYAHQQPQLRITDGKSILQPGKQRSKGKMKEMRSAVGEANQADDLGVAPE